MIDLYVVFSVMVVWPCIKVIAMHKCQCNSVRCVVYLELLKCNLHDPHSQDRESILNTPKNNILFTFGIKHCLFQ